MVLMYVFYLTLAPHSFVAQWVVCHIPIPKTILSYYFIYRDCTIMVHDKELPRNLVVLDIRDFDLILGMD